MRKPRRRCRDRWLRRRGDWARDAQITGEAGLTLRRPVARDDASRLSLLVEFDEVSDERPIFSPVNYTHRIHPEQHVQELKIQSWHRYADGEVLPELAFSTQPPIGDTPAFHDRRRREFDIVGVVMHDGVEVASVPSLTPISRDLPRLLDQHDFIFRGSRGKSRTRAGEAPAANRGSPTLPPGPLRWRDQLRHPLHRPDPEP